MDERVLITRKLTKRYGHFTALAPMDLSVDKGQILGIVGKNGAGKTTLLRMITGQTEPTDGDICLFSQTTAAGLLRARRRTGAIVEAPAFYPNLTAFQNMEYYRIQRGIPDRDRIRYALTQAGIEDTGKKKYKNFSLGMKQRLGIALTLLSSPDLLILDEPLNGLDPMGIVEMRNLLQRLNKEKGITIIISSHILGELSNVATDYAFIDQGQLIEHISAKELHKKCKRYLEIRVDNQEKAAALLEQRFSCTDYEVLPGGVIHIYEGAGEPAKISAMLISGGVALSAIEAKGADLEEYFVSLLGGERRA